MGYQELLYALDLPFASEDHLKLSDTLFERLSFAAISASADLAEERGAYASFAGSKWSRGLFPADTVALLEAERGLPLDPALSAPPANTCDWGSLKERVRTTGLRHSNLMAIAPTATIANIVGTTPCIEPTFKNLYVTSNLSGEFTVINRHLVADLEAEGLWDEPMAERLKAADGQLSRLDGIPERLVRKYPDIFEAGPGRIDQSWLIRAAAIRGRWIDQSQSLNLFVSQPSGKLLHELYTLAWRLGLKTTYYLRTLGASQVEKATVDTAIYGKTHQRSDVQASSTSMNACAIDNPECEACQ
jgi:ribonucleoside-diphosphate reductase alpha chain